ncbi:exodeoxyribonuclease VII large subunit [Cetobacterium somerae]|uniref:exodeoxyribonuclease VII large subunit n=1 Tax=Cetobacterium somerae TaxID=188913 RepID=UPI00248DD59C|nr:exodeoxyribonuclease VII large subunit [Cetobacterium somerae]
MNIRSVEKINMLFKETLDKTEEFIVEGYCSYGNSKRTKEYRYCSLVDENFKFKIDLLEGKEELLDGVFYILKVRFYPRKGFNEFGLRVIKVIEKFENKLLLNQNHLTILKNKIDKGYVEIDNYLKNLIMPAVSNEIRIGIITLKKSIAFEDISATIKKEHKGLILLERYDISIDSFKDDFFKIKNKENNVDLWAIVRGGGDLTFFNSLELLKEISILKKPILTALGHSTDKTLSDFCSDRYFETPTSLGNYLKQILTKIYLEKNQYKNYNDILLKNNNLERQVKALEKEIENKEKLILLQSKQIITKKNEIESLKKVLEVNIFNNNSLKKMDTTLNNIQNSLHMKSHFNFTSLFKNLSPNIKKIIYVVCIISFIRIIMS